jgi:uncharacterized protein (DUF1684 family)
MLVTAVMSEHLDLADWRRRVAAMYAAVRIDTLPDAERLLAFRAAKDRLFGSHPQSPVPADQRGGFAGLPYWTHDPSMRIDVRLEPDPEAAPLDLPRSGEGAGFPYHRIGWVSVAVAGTQLRLAVYWLNEYSGGIFIPFRDGTSGHATYGAGRYLWDSAKGADLGSTRDALVIDFNYAYHPSCVYDPRWSCPLALAENWLTVPIEAGERLAEPRE